MKRWLSVLLTLCLCVGLVLPAAAADTEDVTVPKDYWTDEGNYKIPSIDAETRTVSIASAAELAWVAWKCMQGTTFAEYTILLENDIDLSGHNWTSIGGVDAERKRVTPEKPFSGIFDGQGHKINGLQFYKLESYENFYGLFGNVIGGTIQNLSLDGYVKAYDMVSMLVGYLSGYILNCDVQGTIDVIYADDINALVFTFWDGAIFNSFVNCSFLYDGRTCQGNLFSSIHYSTSIVNCCWNAETILQSNKNNFENCYAIPANNTVDYAEKLNDVMIEGAAKWVMGEDGYPTLDFNDRVQNWVEVAEAVTPVDGVYYIESRNSWPTLQKSSTRVTHWKERPCCCAMISTCQEKSGRRLGGIKFHFPVS